MLPVGDEVPPLSKGYGVPKTLELRTARVDPDVSGKAEKIVF